MAFIDLTGQRFGRWTVLEKSGSKNGVLYWKCQCDCGTIKDVRGQGLREGKSLSCGCYKKDSQTKNIIGQKFGRLTVIGKTEKTTKDHYIIWLCKCDCGNICEVDTHSLKRGNTQSCGCFRKEQASKANSKRRNNLLNKKFGLLTVISDEGYANGHHLWKCKCECGNEIITKAVYLTSGHKNSCGCLKQSIGELNIEQCLIQHNIKYKSQHNPNIRKYFDFALLDDNNQVFRLIEFDGIQHYEETNFFKWSLSQIQASDQIKNEYALSHNIPLVRIPYWERDNITLDMIMGEQYEVPKSAQTVG